jgi:hypothetical protein
MKRQGSKTELSQSSASELQEKLIQVAQTLGDEELALARLAPKLHPGINQYYTRALAQSLKSPTRSGSLQQESLKHQRLIGFLSVAFYRCHGRENSPNALRDLCLANQITPEQGATVFSLLREFMAWEPATDSDLTLAATADRSIIRSARVAAESVDPELFIRWLEGYTAEGNLERARFEDARSLLESSLDETSNRNTERNVPEDEILQIRLKFILLVRSTLRDFGLRFGRAKLTELREKLGAIPQRNEPQKPALTYSQDVVLLAGHYAKLSPEERRAFKVLMQRADANLATQESATN